MRVVKIMVGLRVDLYVATTVEVEEQLGASVGALYVTSRIHDKELRRLKMTLATWDDARRDPRTWCVSSSVD